MKFKEIESMSARQITSLSDEDVKAAYATVRKTVARRRREFGLKNRRSLGKYPIKKNELPATAKVKSIEKMKSILLKIVPRLRGALTTWKGYKQHWEEQRKLFQELYGDYHGITMTKKTFNEFGRFMGEMQKRYKEMWDDFSETALDVFFYGKTLKIDTKTLSENFDYYRNKMDDMKNAAEAVRQQGKWHLTPSKAIAKFKL